MFDQDQKMMISIEVARRVPTASHRAIVTAVAIAADRPWPEATCDFEVAEHIVREHIPVTDLTATSERFGSSTHRYNQAELQRLFSADEREQLVPGEPVVREDAGCHGRLTWALAA